jgi:outer membrane beta-barrel protein
MMSRRNQLLPIVAFLLAPAVAGAQTEEEGAPPEPEATEVEQPAEEAPATEAPVVAAAPTGNAPFPRISDDEETIYAVQRKAFLVNRKFEVTVMGSASFTDRFVQSFGPAAAVTYHLAENFGLQAFGVFMFPTESGLTDEILREGQLRPEVAKLTQMLWGAGIGAEWSPIYGKLELFGASLGNFNFFVNVGAGLGQTRVLCQQGQLLDENVHGPGSQCQLSEPGADPFDPVYEPSRLQFMTAIGGGVRFYFSNQFGLKLEIKDWLFPARVFSPGVDDPSLRFTDAIRNNLYVQLGLSYLIGGEE